MAREQGKAAIDALTEKYKIIELRVCIYVIGYMYSNKDAFFFT